VNSPTFSITSVEFGGRVGRGGGHVFKSGQEGKNIPESEVSDEKGEHSHEWAVLPRDG